jgi:two-component system, sensor histidine kinase ChiS
MLKISATKKNLTLEYTCNASKPVYIDYRRIQQVLWNLIGNAIKFTEKGGINIKALPYDEKFLKVEITDTGIGILPDHIPLVFEAFRQISPSNIRTYGGTGLGVPISSELLRLHGVKLEVESNVNVGSVFHFLLPFAKQKKGREICSPPSFPKIGKYLQLNNNYIEGLLTNQNPTQSSSPLKISPTSQPPATSPTPVVSPPFVVSPPPVLSPNSLKKSKPTKVVLCVDDNPLNLKILKRFLANSEFQSIEVENGAKALEAVKTHRYIRIILMDIMMPTMDGYETTTRIRQLNNGQDFIIIFVSAKPEEKKGYEVGGDDYLLKPVQKKALIRKMRFHLAKKKKSALSSKAEKQ